MAAIPVLFVDDEEDIRFSFEDRFEDRFPVLLAKNGQEGLDIIKGNPEIGVVVTDIRMPELDGLEMIKAARTVNPDVGFIVVSGHGDSDDIIHALRLGARNYLAKPYDFNELEEAIVQEQRRYRFLLEDHAREERELSVTQHLDSVDSLTYLIPNELSLVDPLAFRLVRFLEAMGICTPGDRGNVGLALVELITNAVEHGNLEISALEKIDLKTQGDQIFYDELIRRSKLAPYNLRKVKVVVSLTKDQAVFRIEDEGSGFDYLNLPDPTNPDNLFLPSGRGIFLAQTFLDEVTYLGGGNVVVAVKRPSQKEEAEILA